MPTTAYLPEARDDIDAAYVHFESRQPGLGDRFVDELKRVVGLIESNPHLYGVVFDRVRAAMLRRFPYVIYYQEQTGQLLIVAVRHGHDNPAVWQSRVPSP
jgi:plasmid stabilization system protein ParE